MCVWACAHIDLLYLSVSVCLRSCENSQRTGPMEPNLPPPCNRPPAQASLTCTHEHSHKQRSLFNKSTCWQSVVLSYALGAALSSITSLMTINVCACVQETACFCLQQNYLCSISLITQSLWAYGQTSWNLIKIMLFSAAAAWSACDCSHARYSFCSLPRTKHIATLRTYLKSLYWISLCLVLIFYFSTEEKMGSNLKIWQRARLSIMTSNGIQPHVWNNRMNRIYGEWALSNCKSLWCGCCLAASGPSLQKFSFGLWKIPQSLMW